MTEVLTCRLNNPYNPNDETVMRSQTVSQEIHCYPEEWLMLVAELGSIEPVFTKLAFFLEDVLVNQMTMENRATMAKHLYNSEVFGNWLISCAIKECLTHLKAEHKYFCLWQYDAPVEHERSLASAIEKLEASKAIIAGLSPPVCNQGLNFPVPVYQWLVVKAELVKVTPINHFDIMQKFPFQQVYVTWLRQIITANPEAYGEDGPILHVGRAKVEHSVDAKKVCQTCRIPIKTEKDCGVCGDRHHKLCVH